MIYREERRDLFTVGSDYYLAHCVSADFKLGAGIAVEFNKRYGMRRKLLNMAPISTYAFWDNMDMSSRGMSILVDNVFNLVTKRNYYNKPTMSSIKNALNWMRNDCLTLGIKKIAMPKIGCGLDGLSWPKVSDTIKQVFCTTDIEILICYLQ